STARSSGRSWLTPIATTSVTHANGTTFSARPPASGARSASQRSEATMPSAPALATVPEAVTMRGEILYEQLVALHAMEELELLLNGRSDTATTSRFDDMIAALFGGFGGCSDDGNGWTPLAAEIAEKGKTLAREWLTELEG